MERPRSSNSCLAPSCQRHGWPARLAKTALPYSSNRRFLPVLADLACVLADRRAAWEESDGPPARTAPTNRLGGLPEPNVHRRKRGSLHLPMANRTNKKHKFDI